MQDINFEEIVNNYRSLIFKTAIGFLHSREDAEDLTQEIFIRAYHHISSFRGDSEISTWLYRIAVNMSINATRQRARRNIFLGDESVFKRIFSQASSDMNPQQQIESNETDAIIRKAIDKLPEKQRTAFVLSRYNDLPQKEISAIMNISEGAVEQLLIRAKNNLQKKLTKIIGK